MSELKQSADACRLCHTVIPPQMISGLRQTAAASSPKCPLCESEFTAFSCGMCGRYRYRNLPDQAMRYLGARRCSLFCTDAVQ